MDLYFACNCRYRRKRGISYINGPIKDAKVVACPFCGVSTSSEEMLEDDMYRVFFKCFTCENFAIASRSVKLVTKEEVEKMHPHIFVTDDVRFHVTKIHKIVSISTRELMSFATPKYMTNDDILEFYDNLKKFGYENKVDVDGFVCFDVADKFLKDNKLAKKYKIEYAESIKNANLSLRVNDYSLSNIPFSGAILVTFVDENDDENIQLV